MLAFELVVKDVFFENGEEMQLARISGTTDGKHERKRRIVVDRQNSIVRREKVGSIRTPVWILDEGVESEEVQRRRLE